MTRELALAIMIALGILLLVGMTLSIYRRRKRDSAYGPFPGVSDVPGDVTISFRVVHIATTLAKQPMERVWASPLAYRANTVIEIRPGGLTLTLSGEGDLGIPGESISGAGLGTWTIDKAVDPGGLVVVTWRHGVVEFDSYFRAVDHTPGDVLSAIETILPSGAKESA